MKFRNQKDLIFFLDRVKVEVLGDPHLGKRFNAGVPLTRRGEREQMVIKDFQDSVMNTRADLHVCMGDLFDSFTVDDTTIVTASVAYKAAADLNKDTQYFIIMGNHDMSRDKERMSSFRVFKETVDGIPNIHVVDEPCDYSINTQHLGFFPYDPFRTSAEVMKKYSSSKFNAIFGHWDLDSFGEDPHNMFPVEQIKKITDQAFTGHVHLPDIRNYDNLELVVVGSMQPYSHSEDPEHQLYVSLTLDMLKNTDPKLLKDKCVRLILAPGEEAPEGLDALQYITKKLDALEDDDDLDVVLEDFDFRIIINNELMQQGVTDSTVLGAVMGEFDRLRSEQMV